MLLATLLLPLRAAAPPRRSRGAGRRRRPAAVPIEDLLRVRAHRAASAAHRRALPDDPARAGHALGSSAAVAAGWSASAGTRCSGGAHGLRALGGGDGRAPRGARGVEGGAVRRPRREPGLPGEGGPKSAVAVVAGVGVPMARLERRPPLPRVPVRPPSRAVRAPMARTPMTRTGRTRMVRTRMVRTRMVRTRIERRRRA